MKPKRTIIFYINASLRVPYIGNKCTAHETHGRKWMRSNGVPSQSQHHHQQEKESDNVNCITCMYLPEIQRLARELEMEKSVVQPANSAKAKRSGC